MSETLARKKKRVKLIPTVGSSGEATVEVPENATVADAISMAYGGKLKGKRIVLQNENDEPITQDTKAEDVEEVRITPFTEGGQLQGDARRRRIFTEASKLASAHPDIVLGIRKLSCIIHPSKGPGRRITVQIPDDYPFLAPRVIVKPYEDLRGISHIFSEGEVCYMHLTGWDPNLHTLAYVFTQAKRIVYAAVVERYGK